MKFSDFYADKLLMEAHNLRNYNVVQGVEILPYFAELYGHGKDLNAFANANPAQYKVVTETFREYADADGGVDETGRPNSDTEKWNHNDPDHSKFVNKIRSVILHKLTSEGLAPQATMSAKSQA